MSIENRLPTIVARLGAGRHFLWTGMAAFCVLLVAAGVFFIESRNPSPPAPRIFKIEKQGAETGLSGIQRVVLESFIIPIEGVQGVDFISLSFELEIKTACQEKDMTLAMRRFRRLVYQSVQTSANRSKNMLSISRVKGIIFDNFVRNFTFGTILNIYVTDYFAI